MNKLDRNNRQLARQLKSPAQGSRLTGGGGHITRSALAVSTRAEAGAVKRLYIPDFSALDDATTYLGDAPLGDDDA